MLAHLPTVNAVIEANALPAGVLLISGVGVLVLGVVLGARFGLIPDGVVSFRRWIAAVVAGLSLGAGSIHIAVIDAHFAEYPPYGVAFVILAGFQVVWSITYLVAPERSAALAAILVNSGALAVWAASRSVGLPFGPEPGHIEPIGSLDITAGALELALIGVLAWDVGAIGRRVRPALSRSRAAVVVGSMALGTVLLTSTAFAAAGDEPHGGSAHHPEPEVAGSPSASPVGPPPSLASPPDLAIIDPPGPVSPGSPPAAPPTVVPPSEAPAPAASPTTSPPPTSPPPTPSRAPEATPRPATPVPPTPKPAPTSRPVVPQPGTITFGTSISPSGAIEAQATEFHAGERAVRVADFAEAPNTPMVKLFIVQVLADGREFEHWREDIPVADPAARRLVGGADLSIYLHGGDGRHVMRYMRGDTLLAEGEFELLH